MLHELGAGGMATVYLAEDVRHRRHVAVKVLHPELSAILGPERFLQEIELTASLQHPHILPLFDSGSADGLLYYVMPYVEGETLRARLERERQLPVADAVRIATGVAAALEYAHRRGIVHRDIKPENILLQEGSPVVADFGIALAVQRAGGSRMTQTGMSIGTPQYMAPEQAMGDKTVDHRADIYALGTVAYEMLIGEPPYTGPTAQAIVAQVLTEPPRPLRVQRHTVPLHVEAAILRALEKLPADRFGSAAEFADGLARPGVAAAGAADTAAPRPPRRARVARGLPRLTPWGLAAAGILVAAWSLTRAPDSTHMHPVVRYSVVPPEDAQILDVGGPAVAVHPEGIGMVYVGLQMGRPRRLYRWAFDGSPPAPIPGTDNVMWPFFSPDGEWVGFVSGGQLRKVRHDGSGVATVGPLSGTPGTFRGATWTSKGEIVFATAAGGLFAVPAEGGTPRQIRVDAGDLLRFPTALPSGDYVVVSLLPKAGSNLTELGVVSVATGQLTLLGPSGSNPKYVDPGFLTFINTEGTLLAAPFDARRRKVTGPPRSVAEGLSVGGGGVAKLDVGRSGTVVYLEGQALEARRLLRVDRRGEERVLDAPPRSYNGPRIAPDGRRIAFTLGTVPNPPMDVWVYDLALGTLTRITRDSTSVHPEWSADGRRLYHRRASNVFQAMATTLDGSAPPESLYASSADIWEVVPSRSGDTLVVRVFSSVEDERDLMLVPLRPPGPAQPLAAGPGIQVEPALSPDGKWVAYASDESGSFEVYIRAFPGPGPRYPVSSSGGTSPRWNPRGGEIFYLSADSLIAVPVGTRGGALELGRGRALFANRYAALNFHAPYDVAPDGSWFVFVGGERGPATAGFRVVHNWFDQPGK